MAIKMKRIKVTVVLDDDVESLLRNHMRKKGDLSKIVNEALREYFGKER